MRAVVWDIIGDKNLNNDNLKAMSFKLMLPLIFLFTLSIKTSHPKVTACSHTNTPMHIRNH